MNRIADDMNCDTMLRLARKHQDENKIIQDFGLIPEAWNAFNVINDTGYLPSMNINSKHCIYKREENNMDWWDKQYNSPQYCIPDKLMINTKNKININPSVCNTKPYNNDILKK